MIRFACPTCKATLTSEQVGAKFHCQNCGQRVQVPPPASLFPSAIQAGQTEEARKAHHHGVEILILAGLGAVSGPLMTIFGPLAWILGNKDLREIHAGRMDPEGEFLTRVGRTMGIIETVVVVVGVIGTFLFYIFARPSFESWIIDKAVNALSR